MGFSPPGDQEEVEYHRGLTWDLSCLTPLSVTWRKQWSALLSYLQMAHIWRNRCTLEGRIAIQMDLHRLQEQANRICNSTRTNTEHCPWQGSIGVRTQAGALCRTGPGGQTEHEPAVCPGRRHDQRHPGQYSQGHSQNIERRDYIHLLSTREVPSGYSVQVLGSPVQER